jgi:DNA-binding response OmpR family regulator
MRLPGYPPPAGTRPGVPKRAVARRTTGGPRPASISHVRVLVVEDEVCLASLIRRGLRERGLLADVAVKGEDAFWMAASSSYEHRSNVIDVYVRYLREKLDRPFSTDSIETVRGVGYRLRSR